MDVMQIANLTVTDRVKGVQLSLNRGEIMGLIGPNGAGKSSLLLALAGVLPYQGEVVVNGNKMAQLSDQSRARQIALQPQFIETQWSLSVHDVVSMGRLPWGDSNQAIITQAMAETGIADMAHRPVDQLSGGERARVWLARVLANQADILLMDEPVANLDIHYQKEVMQLLQQQRETGQSMLVAIHDLSLAARYCDRLCLMDQGQVVKIGTVAEVLDPQLLQAVYCVDVWVDLHNRLPVVLPL